MPHGDGRRRAGAPQGAPARRFTWRRRIVTAAALKLFPRPTQVETALVGLGSVAEARRMQIAMTPKLSVLASIRPAACACTLRGLLTNAPR